MFGKCELGEEEIDVHTLWKCTGYKQVKLETQPPPAPPETEQKKNTVNGNDMLEKELHRWINVPNNVCEICTRTRCRQKNCQHLHLVCKYTRQHILREGERMKQAGIQSYELKHVKHVGSSVSGTAASPVAASSSPPERRWEHDMNQYVTFAQMKAYQQTRHHLRDWQVLEHWDNLPKAYQEAATSSHTLPKQSNYSSQEAATSSLSEEVRWDWGMQMWVTFNEWKPCLQCWGFTDDQVLKIWDSLPPKLFDCSDQEDPTRCKRAGSSGLRR